MWGSPEPRAKLHGASKADVVGGGFGAFEAYLELGVVNFLVCQLFFAVHRAAERLVGGLWGLLRGPQDRPDPKGTAELVGRSMAIPVMGVVTAAAAERFAPFGAARCAAWGVVFTQENHDTGPIILRDGHTTGLELTLDDGRVIHVPEGRCRVVGPRRAIQPTAVARYLDEKELGPAAPGTIDDFPLFPADGGTQVVLRVGDRVLLRGKLAPAGGAYRDHTHHVTEDPVELAVVG